MSHHQELGKRGEEIASNYLKDQGHKVLERNWQHEKSEIDIIIQDQGEIVFVEVKTRSNEYFGLPEEAVGEAKQRKLAEGAAAYIEKIDFQGEIRFDIISVILNQQVEKVHHIKDAFFPFE